MTDTQLTLHEAAEVLGVHYMTAYRYVRLGLLDAEKVRGTWRVERADLDAFRTHAGDVRAGDVRAGDVSGDGVDGEPDTLGDVDVLDVIASDPTRDPGARRRRAPWADRLEARLVAGDSRGAWGVVEAALSAGSCLDEIYIDVLGPALTSIGCRWEKGEIDVAIEHRASVIALRMIGRLGPRFSRRGRTRGVVVVGAPQGELHSLPVAMLADLLRQRGWDVADLGGNVPTASLGRFVAGSSDQIVAVGLSVSTDTFLEPVTEAIAAVRAASASTLIVLGGAAITDLDHARSLGADQFATDGRAFVAMMETLPLTV